MTALSNAHGNNILDASMATAAFTASVAPMKVRLMTANGSQSANGTEAAGGSYASQTVTFGAASAQGSASNVTLTYAGMPAATIVGCEIWDSAGTPLRKWWGALTASKVTNNGDTFSIASGSLTLAFA